MLPSRILKGPQGDSRAERRIEAQGVHLAQDPEGGLMGAAALAGGYLIPSPSLEETAHCRARGMCGRSPV